MKTTNNVQKAILKSLAVVVSFILISFTVNAQGFWESLLENSTFTEIALAMSESNSETNQAADNTGSTADINTFAVLLEQEMEESLELENWMTDEANFTSSFEIEEEVESPLEIEDWMSNESYFTGALMSLEVETEEALAIEDWMLENENFTTVNEDTKIKAQPKYIVGDDYIFVNIDDYKLKFEPWMTDNKIWRN